MPLHNHYYLCAIVQILQNDNPASIPHPKAFIMATICIQFYYNIAVIQYFFYSLGNIIIRTYKYSGTTFFYCYFLYFFLVQDLLSAKMCNNARYFSSLEAAHELQHTYNN